MKKQLVACAFLSAVALGSAVQAGQNAGNTADTFLTTYSAFLATSAASTQTALAPAATKQLMLAASMERPQGLALPPNKAASVSYFTDRGAFEAAAPGLDVEDFSTANVASGMIEGCGPAIADGNSCYAAPGLLEGVEFSATSGVMVSLGSGVLGNTTPMVAADLFAAGNIITFTAGGVYDLGMSLRVAGGDVSYDLSLFDEMGGLIASTTAPASVSGTFWGVVSGVAIGSVTLSTAGGSGETIEDIQFGYSDLRPVIHIPYDEGSGSKASYGFGDGSLFGGSTWGLGQQAGALQFDGTGYTEIVNPADGSLDLTSALSLALWVRPDALGGHQMLVSKDDAYEFEFGKLGDQVLNFRLNNIVAGTALTPIKEGVWQHLAITYDGSTVRFYRNGQPDGSEIRGGGAPVTAANLGLAARPSALHDGGPVFHLKGALDDVRIFDFALDPAKVAALYATTVTDIEVPVRSDRVPEQALEMSQAVDLGLSTDESATCRYATGSGDVAYADMASSLTTGDGVTHRHNLVPAGSVNRYFARCRDSRGNTNTDDYMLGIAVGDVDLEAALETYWTFDDGAGCVATDGTGNHDGTLGPDCGGGNAPQWASAVFGSGLTFDGDDDEVRATNDGGMADPAGFTVSAWLRHSTTQGFRAIADVRDAGADGYNLYLNAQSKLFMRVGGSTLSSPDVVADNTWHHVAGAFDGSTLTLYVDGVEVASSVGIESIDVTADLLLGQNFSQPGYGFVGSLDEVVLHSRALDPEEVLQLVLESQP